MNISQPLKDKEIDISVIIPVYGCDKSLPKLYERLTASLESIVKKYEIILIDDCGPGNTWEIIQSITKRDGSVKGIRLSRNFGQHIAITAGLEESIGSWVVVMDCDLQDKPEEIVKLYEKHVPSIIVRLSNIYGYTKLRRPDLIPTIMQDIFLKEKVSIWSDLPKRDFIFIEDAADAVLQLLNTEYTGVLNLGTGEMNSIKNISKIIENLSGKKITSENKDVSGPLEFIADISKLKKITGWSPKYTLEQGLTKTFKIMKNY